MITGTPSSRSRGVLQFPRQRRPSSLDPHHKPRPNTMRTSAFHRTFFLLLTCGLLSSLAAVQSDAQEKSVRPGINKRYETVEVAKVASEFEGEGRNIVEKKDAILAACQLKPGMCVADIGAGTGLFTRLIAAKVAPGKVYAVDITKKFVDHILATCRKLKIENVTGVVCSQNSTDLTPQSINLAFVCDTYHHFEFPHDTLASIYESASPRGATADHRF